MHHLPCRPLRVSCLLSTLVVLTVLTGPWPGTAAALDFYPTPTLVPSTGQPAAVAVGDLDDDGIVDLVTANRVSGRILIHRGRGDGSFRSPTSLFVGGNPAEIAVADLDRDGLSDAIWADELTGAVGVMLQQPTEPSSYLIESFSGDDEAVSLAVTDHDGDGWLDVLVAHRGADQLSLYHNAQGRLDPPLRIGIGDRPILVRRVRDVPPGPDRIVVVEEGVLSRDLLVLRSADFSVVQRIGMQQPAFVDAVDWNADGLADLISLDAQTGAIQLQQAEVGGGYLSTDSWSAEPGSRVVSVLDGPVGLRRLLVAETERRRVRFFVEDLGGLRPGRAYFTGADVGRFTFSDVDGDQLEELLVPLPRIDAVQIMRPLGEGLLGFEAVGTGRSPLSIVPVERPAPDPPLMSVLCAGSDEVWRFERSGSELRHLDSIPIDSDGIRQAWGDLDGDGHADLAVLVSALGIDIHRALPAGGFSAPVRRTLPADLRDIALVDVVADSSLDLVIADAGMPGLHLLAGDGNGGFGPDSTVVLSQAPVVVSHEDLDLDGREDLVVLGDVSQFFLIFNSATGLGDPITFSFADKPRDVGFGRFNGDVFPDVVIASAGNSTFGILNSVFRGVYGIGTSSQLTPSGAQNVIVSDVDDNGQDDVIFSGTSSQYLSIHLNTGTPESPTGSFNVPTRVRGSSFILDMAATSLDDDARDELLVLDSLGNEIVILRSDPLATVAAIDLVLAASWEDGVVRLTITGDARSAGEFELVRLRDGRRLHPSVVSLGRFEGIDDRPSASGESYAVLDLRGRNLSQASVSPQALVTGVRGHDRSILLPSRLVDGNTQFHFRIAGTLRPIVRIYDVRGRLVSRLDPVAEADGWFRAVWQGEDRRGRATARGPYLVEVRAGKERLRGSFLRP